VGGETLRDAVERQAAARVRRDDATFASFLTPQALLQLSGNGLAPPRLPQARRYEILDISEQDGRGESLVRYLAAGAYAVRTTWERADGVWRGVAVELPPELMRAPWWRRLLGRGPRPAPPVKRRDLS